MGFLSNGDDPQLNEYIRARDILLKPQNVNSHIANITFPNMIRRLFSILERASNEWINDNAHHIVSELTAIRVIDRRYPNILLGNVIDEINAMEHRIFNLMRGIGAEVVDENTRLRAENIRLRAELANANSSCC